MNRVLARSCSVLVVMLACYGLAPQRADAQSSPFGLWGDSWHGPVSNGSYYSYYQPTGTYLPTDLSCCNVVSRRFDTSCDSGCEQYVPSQNQNKDGQCPGRCPGCKVTPPKGEETRLKPTPEAAAVRTRPASRQLLGAEQVVRARKKELVATRVHSSQPAPRYPENDGWIPVSSNGSKQIAQRAVLND